jgi:hypothetical protein
MSEIKSKIGLTPKGAYSSAATYDYLDYVTTADGTYTSKQASNTGHALTETDWWEHDFIAPKMRINATTKNWEISYDGGTTYTDTGISAKGADAVSPQLKIDTTTFNWMLSTDGGTTWTDLGVASKQATSSASVVQVTGTSTTDVMSQKAVTDEINKEGLLAEAIYNKNVEITVDSVDVPSSTFTRAGHGLVNDNIIFPITNGNEGTYNGTNLTPYQLYAGGMLQLPYFVVNATTNTFQLSLTSGGTPIVLTDNATMNLNSWHFEKGSGIYEFKISNLVLPRRFRVEYDLRFNQYSTTSLFQFYSNNWNSTSNRGYTWDTGNYYMGTLASIWIVDYYFTNKNAKFVKNVDAIYADNSTKTIKAATVARTVFQSNYYTFEKLATENYVGVGFYDGTPQKRCLANGSTIRVYKL